METSEDMKFLIEKKLDSTNYNSKLTENGFVNRFANILYNDSNTFNGRNTTFFEFNTPVTGNDVSVEYQIFLAGTWFGRIQMEHITIYDEEGEEVDITFDNTQHEIYQYYAWHDNTETSTITNTKLYIKTLPRMNGGVYFWIMNDDQQVSPFTVSLVPGKNYKIRGYKIRRLIHHHRDK